MYSNLLGFQLLCMVLSRGVIHFEVIDWMNDAFITINVISALPKLTGLVFQICINNRHMSELVLYNQ